MIGSSVLEAFPEVTPEGSPLAELHAALTAAVHTGLPQRMDRRPYDVPGLDGTSQIRYRDASNIPIRGADGAVRYVLHQAIDVTERVRAETALRESARSIEAL